MPAMRSVPLGSQPGDREIASFADLIHRPLVIVGNGPSATFPDHSRIPGDAVVFRMNWFFLESHYHFGSHVDAWFFAIPNQKLEELLREEVRSGRYSLDRVLSPMQAASHRDTDRWGNNFLGLPVEQYDHWAVISRHPRLARYFMSRPGLPTSGMQALGFGLGVGFREIYLSGVDLYESREARYGHTITDEIAATLALKDTTPGYESAHSIDNDLAFLRTSAVEFPDARLYNMTASTNIGLLLPDPAPVQGRPAMSAETTPALGEPKDRVAFELPGSGRIEPILITAPSDTRLWQEIDGRKVAYVTVVSGAYHHGARALANSLRRVTDVPLLALCTRDANRSALTASGIHVMDVPEILNPHRFGNIQNRFAATFTKLNVFRLGFLDRIVYLDSDTVVRKNIDDLFTEEGFAAVPDAGLERPDGEQFNSGVFVVEPSYELFESLLDRLRHTPSSDGGDQGFLNVVFPDWKRLPLEYNTTKRLFAHHPGLYNEDEVKVLHYVGVKPWEPVSAGDRYEELDLHWLENLVSWELHELVHDLRNGTAARAATAGEGLRHGAGLTGSPLRQAQALNKAKAFADAQAVLQEAWSERDPSVAELRAMAQAMSGQGRYGQAAKQLTKAAQLKPGHRGVMVELWLTRARWAHSRITRG